MLRLSDYIIEHAAIDWSDLLSEWAWLLPRKFKVWIVNRFGDLFLILDDGSVHMLDVGGGSLKRVADSRDDFASRLDEDENANDWLMIPLVDKLVAAGVSLRPAECYSYVELPILGGGYTADNTRVVSISQHYKAFGPIHEKLKDLPDGTYVKFEVAERSDEADDASGRPRE